MVLLWEQTSSLWARHAAHTAFSEQGGFLGTGGGKNEGVLLAGKRSCPNVVGSERGVSMEVGATLREFRMMSESVVPRSWITHKDTYVVTDAVKFAVASQPRCIIVENVLGMDVRTDKDTFAPADMLVEELQKAGYITTKLISDLGLFHKVRRQR